jgi:hypothetical protein
VGFLSPVAAHSRILEAISALVVDVRFASGSVALAFSSTAFIKSMSSGGKTVPVEFKMHLLCNSSPALI